MNKEMVDIRPIQFDDNDVSALKAEVESVLYHLNDKPVQVSRAAIEQIRASTQTTLFGAFIGPKLLGLGTLTVRQCCPNNMGIIDNVVVHPDARGKGVGTMLVSHIISHAWAAKCVSITLTSNPKREAANYLYQKLGFTLAQTNAYYLNNPESTVQRP